MTENYTNLFSNLDYVEPREDLFINTLYSIKKIRRKLVTIKIILFSCSFLGSIIVFIPVFNVVSSNFVQSGFSSYVSLLFSDFGLVLSNLDSFILVLLENIPVVGMILSLCIIIVFLESLRYLLRNIIFIFNYYN